MNCKIAYLISAHTDPHQLLRLIEALHPDAEYFVHVDAKSDINPFISLIQRQNVHFIESRVNVRWGTMREVEYQMNLLRAAVSHPSHFDHIFFLSGLDYPLWSPQRITEWLLTQGEREILQGICMDTPLLNDNQRELYTVARPFCHSPKLAILMRKLLRLTGYRKKLHFDVDGREWKLYKGGAWWCISQTLAEYVLDTYDTRPAVKRYFSDSFGPAETLIQTIVFNAPQWASRCMLETGAYPGLAAVTPLHFIDYNPVIKVMDETDYPRLMASGKIFCRKVVSGRSDTLVNMLNSNSAHSS
ncbi:MAG: beta-1,6-N-acetylglucosaminyltransferase [Bacteroidaceae bacterium]|nr:beta-1,6-N-acetylglucosaminyltransferase [Bacteroidaceae bacterium]